jgi:hypothetical protein
MAELCRLCGGDCEYMFTQPILGKYDVRYFRCRDCKSLETAKPYWLQEAYVHDVHPDDQYYCGRNLEVFSKVKFLLRTLKIGRDATVLDFGGGLGILARMLREAGWNACCFDTYARSPFPDVSWNREAPAFVTAIELFEHLAEPAAEMNSIFGGMPDYVLVRTARYRGEGKEWFYLGPSHGQHIFFYSDEAMGLIAAKYGYNLLLPNGQEALFFRRPMSAMRRRLIRWGLKAGVPGHAVIFASKVMARLL